jgi:hypothetical protein
MAISIHARFTMEHEDIWMDMRETLGAFKALDALRVQVSIFETPDPIGEPSQLTGTLRVSLRTYAWLVTIVRYFERLSRIGWMEFVYNIEEQGNLRASLLSFEKNARQIKTLILDEQRQLARFQADMDPWLSKPTDPRPRHITIEDP